VLLSVACVADFLFLGVTCVAGFFFAVATKIAKDISPGPFGYYISTENPEVRRTKKLVTK
jgi:hypothetical protein